MDPEGEEASALPPAPTHCPSALVQPSAGPKALEW